jgi:hypothetical protein
MKGMTRVMADDKQQPKPATPQTGESQRIVEGGKFSKRGSLEVPRLIVAAPADGPTGAPQAQVEATPPAGSAGETPAE